MSETITELEAHRTALTGHCYRMLGSAVDADDAAQETLIRAWKGMNGFDGRASVKNWLYRIATNVCLDELAGRGRRARPMEEGPVGTAVCDRLVQRPGAHWIEPIPDVRAIPQDADPAERAMLRQSIRLAFVAALQQLAPKQRAALLLADVLGWSAAEIGEALAMSIAAVNSALQRARSTIASRGAERRVPTELSAAQTVLLNRYVSAFERYDVDELVSLLRADATFSMPPYELWLQGPESVRTWMLGTGSGCRGSKLVPAAACGSPAFGQYRVNPEGGYKAWALVVLELSDSDVEGINSFLDTEALFPKFGLPMTLPGN